jgi:7,8-dihydropterin-6-yl-methyl-4-(beta-D-ribofuranosyl)aminobenzene 5'-phosphate synthase
MDFSNHQSFPGRRDVIRGGASLTFSALTALLFQGAKPAQAAPLEGGAPEIDQLTLRIVTDSYQMATAPDAKIANVEIKRFGFAVGDHPPGKAILSEFGLSLHAESRIGRSSAPY